MKNDFIKNKNIKNQPNKAVKKTFSFYALVFALLFMFIGSILGSIAFVRTSNNENSVNVAHADSVESSYNYKGSNLFLYSSRWRTTGTSTNDEVRVSSPYTDNIYMFNISLEMFLVNNVVVNSNGLVLPKATTIIPTIYYGTRDNYSNSLLNVKPILNGSMNPYFIDNTIVANCFNINSNGGLAVVNSLNQLNNNSIITNTYYGIFGEPNLSNTILFGEFISRQEYGFNCDVVKIEISSNYIYPSPYGTQNARISNIITYTDLNGYTLQFISNSEYFIPTIIKDNAIAIDYFVTPYLLEDRTYYIGAVDSDSELVVNAEVERRVNEIKNDYENQINTANNKYNSLLNQLPDIKQSEFERGKLQGALESNSYSFLGLIGSLFDAPIQALSGLLNFDILGFNLWNFFTAIITVAIVIFVVRLFL